MPDHTVTLTVDRGRVRWGWHCPHDPNDPDRPCRPRTETGEPVDQPGCVFKDWWDALDLDLVRSATPVQFDAEIEWPREEPVIDLARPRSADSKGPNA